MSRDFRGAARVRLHQRLARAVSCYDGGPATTVTARLHKRQVDNGDLQGARLGFAQIQEITPRLIFMYLEHVPVRGNVYTFPDGDAYLVETVLPRESVTIAAECSPVGRSKLASYPYVAAP